MDGQRFDDLVKTLATTSSRRRVLKGMAVGAVGAAFGLRRATNAGAAASRTLGDACKPGPTGTEQGTCASGQNLFCQKVAATGAYRCECTTGFVGCGGACVAISCPGGGQLDTTTCTCGCPASAPLCNGSCINNTCPDGQTFDTDACHCVCNSGCSVAGQVQNPTTCACACPSGTAPCDDGTGSKCVNTSCSVGTFNETTCTCGCASTEVYCGGACQNPTTVCGGFHNKIFNIECCNQGYPCQNPGQPSGRCKAY